MSCDRVGCPDPEATGTHWHCGRCESPALTSMMGHYRRDPGPAGREWYTCAVEDLPAAVTMAEQLQYIATSADSNGGHVTPDEVETIRTAADQLLKFMTTEAELEALPTDTVIVGRGDKYDNEYSNMDWGTWQKDTFGLWRSWQYVDGFPSLKMVTVNFLPIRYTVVWMPPAKDGE